MIEAVLAIAGAVAGIWFWFLKNRAKDRLQNGDQEIETRNDKRKKAIDGWVRGPGGTSWWIDRD